MSGSDSISDHTAFAFGSASNERDNGSDSVSSAGAFTFTSPRTAATGMNESGYLDDAPSTSSTTAGSSRSQLGATSLFATLAQRQFDQQQQLSQSQYDDESAWTTSRPHRYRHTRHSQGRRAEIDDVSTSSSSSSGRRERRARRDSLESDYSDETTSSAHDRALQREWEEQVDQLKLMFQIIILPFVGKFFGRKFGYFLYNRYQVLGSPLRQAFWSGIGATA
ncbi:hypothetical protein EX895_000441 [Sporisorium graminicola]|uniref:Uncharacterized protein n=1 Tax=Sporisorium graminicola TaxID=280036 RepID=A0A4U7L023_9BASI|nr:hypothetical protein EX895_000441 [Sporisorium graminicola]TKY90443.1 hypothetical protein EX895_000441 [Sporisorium graminicola]